MGIKLSGLISNLDTDSIVKELVSAYSTKKENIEKAQTKLSWKQDTWKAMNTKIYSFYTDSLSDMRFSGTFSSMKETTVSDSTKASVTADSTVANGTQTVKVSQLATAGYLTGEKLSSGSSITSSTKLSDISPTLTAGSTLNLKVGGVDKPITITADMTVGGFTSALKSAGVSASFDTTQQRFFINSNSSGEDNDFSFSATTAAELEDLEALGLATADNVGSTRINTEAITLAGGSSSWDILTAEEQASYIQQASGKYATKQDATNSIIELNGATFESSSNTITVNGLTINAKGVTDSAITITTETDVDGIYEKIKSFLKEYNTLINGMDESYNADSSKGYEPLTDDEKDAMTDTEIEKWEAKIKDSLLRRDSTLESVSSILKDAMATSVEIDGKDYSLSSFGINTLGYFISADNEKNAYHIDGNKDDSTVSGNKDKLKAAISENPDLIADFFSKLSTNLYTKLTDRMKSTTLNSAYKVYNDKQLQEEYDDYTDKIDDWEDKISDMEDYYYAKFSDMETALSKLQSSTSALSSLLGS